MTVGRDYTPAEELKRGSRGPAVQQLYDYLKRFGYFPDEMVAAPASQGPATAVDPGGVTTFDETMEQAVRVFQGRQGLKSDGWVGPKTLDVLRKPRCGNRDIAPSIQRRRPLSYATYSITNYTSDLPQESCRQAVRGALRQWEAVTSIAFAEESAWPFSVAIGWFSGEHILDHSWFEFLSNGFGHTYDPPYSDKISIGGSLCFSDLETWSVNTPPSGIDTATVALHLMGHLLGLEHSDVATSVMYAYYEGPRRSPTPSDVAAIQALYGPKFRWRRLGGNVHQPVATTSRDGRIEVLALGAGSAMWHVAQTAPNNGWGGWSQLIPSTDMVFTPAVGRNADGRFEVFVRRTDGALWHIRQTLPNNGWSSLVSLDGAGRGTPVVGRNADGRLEVFAQGEDGALWHQWQLSPGGSWSRWASLGGVVTDIAVVSAKDGRLEVFARDNASAVGVIAQTAPSNGWGRWKPLGGAIAGSPAVARNADGRIEVFARGTDGTLRHAWQNSVNGSWSGWATLGGNVDGDPAVIANSDGRLEVFAKDRQFALHHIWQTQPGRWSGWATLGGFMLGTPCPVRNADGRLECVVRSWDFSLWTTWQTRPGGWDVIPPA
ncbi:MAG TPA: matrixin family metalloprotease [Acidimicrobiales bacterium]|nr:matrixin family metalloprotease [Acidimicrobiales bacterium]